LPPRESEHALSTPRPRRPALRASLDGRVPGTGSVSGDPGERRELAHATAAAVLAAARSGGSAPPVDLVERLGGLDVLVELWRDAERGSLPATLLTLHLLRAWCRGSGAEAARLYRAGHADAEVADVVVGVVSPPGPEDLAAVADAVLTSTYTGDLGVALDRAAAFCEVIATGRRAQAHSRAGDDAEEATRQLRLAAGNDRAATDLRAAAGAWRAGVLH
jgi:hypothetical protein